MKEWHKWFVLTEHITYYIVKFIPDGRVFGNDNNVTDGIDSKGGGNIIAMIKFLVQSLVENMKYFVEKNKFSVLSMENYFTLTKLI